MCVLTLLYFMQRGEKASRDLMSKVCSTFDIKFRVLVSFPTYVFVDSANLKTKLLRYDVHIHSNIKHFICKHGHNYGFCKARVDLIE